MTQRLPYDICSGCAACAHACPTQCISMLEDDEGFLRPVVHEDACVDCGLCSRICPALHSSNEQGVPDAYAVKALDEQMRLSSSSGGFFTLLAEAILEQGGVVFGAAFDESFSVSHVYVKHKEQLHRLRGSKYVQSNIGNTFREAKNFLESGRMVLFSGTPCQIEGLLAYLQKPYENLITQDIICHGVPSPLAWRIYLTQLERRFGSFVELVSFRDKSAGWRNYSLKILFSNGKNYRKSVQDDAYLQCFSSNLSLRPSCYQCSFKKLARVSDFTLADFWGIEHIVPSLDDNTGVSLVFCHTEKAKELFATLQDKLSFSTVDAEQSVRFNSAMYHSVPCPKNREAFFKEILVNPYKKVTHQYCQRPAFKVRVARAVKRLSNGVRKFLHR